MSSNDSYIDPSERVRDSKKITRLMKNSHIGIYDSDHRDFFNQRNQQLIQPKGLLPQIDLTGFDQESKDHSTGLTKVWHGVQELFGKHHQTLDEQIREKVLEDLKNSKNPEGQAKYKDYQQEEQAIQKYKDEISQWGMQSTINPGKFPEAPDCPTHKLVQMRGHLEESKIVAQVRAQMTPVQIAQVDADAKKYAEGVEEARTIHNPMGTGEGFKTPPAPSDDLAKYWRLLQEQTDVKTFH